MRTDLKENDSVQKAHINKDNLARFYGVMEKHPNITAIRKFRTKPYDIDGCKTLPITAKRNR